MNTSRSHNAMREAFGIDWIVSQRIGVDRHTGKTLMISGRSIRASSDTLYLALRSRMHIRRSMSKDQVIGSDLVEMFANRAIIVSYMHWVQDPILVGQEVSQDLCHAFAFMSRSLRRRKVRELVAAHRDMDRAVLMTDIIGRHNPGAAMMAARRALEHVDERIHQMQSMLSHIGFVEVRLYAEIDRHRRLYERLLAALGGRKGDANRAVLMKSHSRDRSMERIELAIREALKLEQLFRGVRAHPFRRNAKHTAEDLRYLARTYKRVLNGANAETAWSNIDNGIRRLRQGIVWVFARHELEMNVMFPLAFLLADMEDHGVMVQKAVGGSYDECASVELPDFRERVMGIHERMHDIHRNIRSIPQDKIRYSPQSQVLAHLVEAMRYLQAHDVKESKKEIGLALSSL